MSDIFIHARDLCFSYTDEEGREENPALQSFSVDIRRGEYVAVLGHNGSGKSTFAKLLNYILEPTSGELIVNGLDLSRKDLSDEEILNLRKNVGMVFQNPDNQLVATIVEQDVAFGPENLGVPREELRRRVDSALETVGMSAYAGHEPHRLSGGQKQRVAIAGVMAMQPKCIIFDESTAMLDPLGRKEVMNSIIKLNREKNITVVMITHYMDEAAMADRIVVLNDGALLLDGTPSEVFSNMEMLRQFGLEAQQATELLHELNFNGENFALPCLDEEECVRIILEKYNSRR